MDLHPATNSVNTLGRSLKPLSRAGEQLAFLSSEPLSRPGIPKQSIGGVLLIHDVGCVRLARGHDKQLPPKGQRMPGLPAEQVPGG